MGSRIYLTGAFVLVVLALATPAQASAPPAPPQATCVGGLASSSPGLPIPDVGTLASPLPLATFPSYVLDVDVETHITHTWPGDLDITLTSPAGTVVTLTTDNGTGNDNVFNGTLWDDDGGDTNPPGAVTDTAFGSNVVETPLVPEEALGAFVGENPNGTWTLTVTDDEADDLGTLVDWSLNLLVCSAPPPSTPLSASNATLTVIPPIGIATSSVAVSGGCTYITDLNVTTYITHTWSDDLDITLTSPAGTVVTLTTDNGTGNDNVFYSTLWDDDGGDTNPPGAVTDTAFVNNVAETTLVPEEAFGAFVGENPNGTWTLSIEDDMAAEGGSLDHWSISGGAACAPPPPPPTQAQVFELRISDVAVKEGNRGTKAARFLVRLSRPATVPITVSFTTQNGTAKARSDYRTKKGTLTFAPGVTELPLVVRVRGDLRDEKRERFFVVLSNAVNATLADARGRATIRDND